MYSIFVENIPFAVNAKMNHQFERQGEEVSSLMFQIKCLQVNSIILLLCFK